MDQDNDGTIDIASDGGPGTGSTDLDRDGLADEIEADVLGINSPDLAALEANAVGTDPRNSDGDGVDDYLDLDSDNDGISDFIEAQPTIGYQSTDGDVTDQDSDGDGVIDLFDNNSGEFGGAFLDPVDTNGINGPDYLDLNSDVDGIPDEQENGLDNTGGDLNGDGIQDNVGVSYTDPSGGISNLLTQLTNDDVDPTETDFRSAPCFVRGTLIATVHGQVAIEDLKVGDRVFTRDNGFQEIRWIGSREVAATGRLAPIRFKAGTIGNAYDLLLSPLHRVLLAGWQMELILGCEEALAAAKTLVNGDTITIEEGGRVEYYHILFDRHEIILSNGAPTESFHPGLVGIGGLEEEAREEIYRLFPELRKDGCESYGRTARQVLKNREVNFLLSKVA